MANAHIVITTPRGKLTTYQRGNGQFITRLDWNPGFGAEYTGIFKRKQAFVDSECIRLMAKYTPRRTGALIKSATLGTTIGSGEIHQIMPYARKNYYNHKSKSYWFEHMKNNHKTSILRRAERVR